MQIEKIDSFKVMAHTNSKLVLDIVCRSGEISRAELARRTHLQPATICNIASDLIEKEILIESTKLKTNQRAGRPARLLKLNDTARLVLAIDIEPDKLRIAITNFSFEIIAYSETEIDRTSEPETIIDKIKTLCGELLATNKNWASKMIGVGVSLPGIIDKDNGILRSCTNMPKWNNINIVSELNDYFDVPIKIDRSTHLAALSEKWRRPELYKKNILCLTLRTGIGISILTHGQLYNGASLIDGEIGHTIVNPNGKICQCGKIGCLETYTSSAAILSEVEKLFKDNKGQEIKENINGNKTKITLEFINKLARNGNVICKSMIETITYYISLSIGNIIQVLNPHELVIFGSLDLNNDIMVEMLCENLKKFLLPQTFSDLSVSVSPYKEKASLYGAAALIFDDFLSLQYDTDFNPKTFMNLNKQ